MPQEKTETAQQNTDSFLKFNPFKISADQNNRNVKKTWLIKSISPLENVNKRCVQNPNKA